tara:strand:+ start:5471 stop:6472 length:1002 start_codon:yes stop_codon:yes gene_type:complete
MNSTVLVTGSAGFIGSALTMRLLDDGYKVIGVDNHNDYYDPHLKESRLERFVDHQSYLHIKEDISNRGPILEIFEEYKFDIVVNLAAQAGVRYSIENPNSYVNSNLVGFGNILEFSKESNVNHLIYASSSSVYGSNTKVPFSTKDNVDHPVSFYAATKKANELMAHSYSHLFNLRTTGLRFFTVYGPWDRPDMALQTFSRAMVSGQSIKIFNNGNHMRDFTYIDDIVEGLVNVMKSGKLDEKDKINESSNYWKVYNIGNSNPVNLIDYISQLESSLGVTANKEYLPIQPGDMKDTYADVSDLIQDFNYRPKTSIKDGISKFAEWYKDYYKVKI